MKVPDVTKGRSGGRSPPKLSRKRYDEDERESSSDDDKKRAKDSKDSSSETGDEEDDYSVGDAGVDYGDPEYLSEESKEWDNKS